MELRKFIGEKIKEYRLDRKMLQEDLAEKLNTTKQTVSRYERGARGADQDVLFQLANIFKVSIDDFFPPVDILQLAKEEEAEYKVSTSSAYTYLPTAISAGLPFDVEGITQTSTIAIPDDLMGRYAGHTDILVSRIFGDSMDKIMRDGSIIAIKPMELNALNNGDIVVFSNDHDYSVKHYYKQGDRLVFRPNSYNNDHHDQVYPTSDNIQIHGKVIMYSAVLD